MKRYEVIVNNEVFEVTLRELEAGEQITPSPQAAAPVTAKLQTESQSSPQDLEITAPMSGTIMKILVKEGQRVKAGDNLFILEAMKMENEIKAPKDGQVKSILVTESQQVETKQALAVL
ncbi:TPA: acetyl-CoA carboxylase biotin carboxyl carrier protein subunit [Streptococcus suis]